LLKIQQEDQEVNQVEGRKNSRSVNQVFKTWFVFLPQNISLLLSTPIFSALSLNFVSVP